MKKRFLPSRPYTATLGILILLGTAGGARADALDELMQSLKAKGVISEADYQRISAARDADKKASAPASANSAATGNAKPATAVSNVDPGNTAQLAGRIQVDYRTYSNKADTSTFEMRRVYFGVKGKLWNDFKYDITGHLNDTVGNGGNGALEDAWLELPGNKQATLKIGQFYTPLGLDDANSSKYTDFMERAAIVNQSQSSNDSPDKGAMLYGEPVNGISYWLAYTNGSSLNVVNTNTAGGKETLMRGVVNFAKLFDQKDAVYHLGFGRASGRKPADLSASPEIGRIRTEGRSWNFRPMKFTGIDNNYDRKRQDIELAAAYGPFKLQSEIIFENYSGTTLGGIGYDKTVRGQYANFMWMITGEKYADNYGGGSFGNTRPSRNFDLRSGGWGAWEVGLRFSRLDAGDLDSTAPVGVLKNAAGFTSGMKETTLGLKWIMNPNARMMFNYVNAKYDQPTSGSVAGLAPVSSDRAYMMRGQVDF